MCRPPKQNLSTFFSELYKCLDKATQKYENIVLMGDINIDTENDKALGINKLLEVCDVFCLENLIKDTTSDTIYGSSSIDVIFTV